ncbi:hypothetical protein Htur_3393 [Haloterrigena turkmenica DSM 5511]|uniref:Uncharacterized protein n=1 Tax=Haloterrigena turkmenica (strain ATCC 51198 / DSM 5511 / JCM 9101 / NCIMB 13204 / VKM B-1734 / 4k) TaxID=543526 RepID=D2RPV4_HALTV|nr:hypothetical protein [Haloterrigena turkmenica]ADB62256.1 hypothetical protein Htur_3393 [Haloterrigena turkmenica DSM 5511]
MERFVRLIVAGGLVLVGALWLVDLFVRGSPQWTVGVALVILGLVGVMVGIVSELESGAFGVE